MRKSKSQKSKTQSDKKGVPLQDYIQQTKGQQIARGMKARKDKRED